VRQLPEDLHGLHRNGGLGRQNSLIRLEASEIISPPTKPGGRAPFPFSTVPLANSGFEEGYGD